MHLGLNNVIFVVLGGLNRGIVIIGSCIGDVGIGNFVIGVVLFVRQVELVTDGRLLIIINLL